MPDGFKQTGGTYSDFVGAELTSSKPSVTYTVKGKFVSETQGGIFQLLRSHKSAGNQSEFVQVGTLAFTAISPKLDSLTGRSARIAVVNNEYIPYMSISALRAGAADTAKVIYINEGLRSGTFRLALDNTTAVDDGSMVLVSGTKRYFREDLGYLRPEWFGADPSDNNDDYQAIQNALNNATTKGLSLELGVGTYIVSNTLSAKIVDGKNQFKLKISGKGRGKTFVKGSTSSLGGKNLVEFIPSTTNTNRRVSYIEVRDISFEAGNSNRILYINYVSQVQINNCFFTGGDTTCVQIGDKITENWSTYVKDCYFIGTATNDMHNKALLRMYSRYAEMSNLVGDGSKYGLEVYSDQCLINGCTLEGYKSAGIYIYGSGGGSHKIYGNTLRPYSGYEAGGIFNGTLRGILIESTTGGSGSNTISSNVIHLGDPNSLDRLVPISNITGVIKAHPDTSFKIVGRNSHAVGQITGYNVVEQRINIQTTSGTFEANEIIDQYNGTNPSMLGSAKLGIFLTNHTYGLSLLGSQGRNTVTANQFTGGMEYAIISTSPNNIFTANVLDSKNGILIENNGTIIGNIITSPTGIAVKKTGGIVSLVNNSISGALDGISPQMFSNITTSERDALVSPPAGLILYDVTVNKHKKFNGSTWSYFDNTSSAVTDPRWISGTTRLGSLNDAANSGLKTWGMGTPNTPSTYGTVFTFVGATADGNGTADNG